MKVAPLITFGGCDFACSGLTLRDMKSSTLKVTSNSHPQEMIKPMFALAAMARGVARINAAASWTSRPRRSPSSLLPIFSTRSRVICRRLVAPFLIDRNDYPLDAVNAVPANFHASQPAAFVQVFPLQPVIHLRRDSPLPISASLFESPISYFR